MMNAGFVLSGLPTNRGKRMRIGLAGTSLFSVLLGLGLGASLAMAGPIEERQALMKDNGKAIGALAAIAKKEQPFDAKVVKKNAEKMAHNFEVLKDLFPEGSQKGEK